jgi:hypothetical protein
MTVHPSMDADYVIGSDARNFSRLQHPAAAGACQAVSGRRYRRSAIVQIGESQDEHSECRRVVSVPRVAPYVLELDAPLKADHSQGTRIMEVNGPFTHFLPLVPV